MLHGFRCEVTGCDAAFCDHFAGEFISIPCTVDNSGYPGVDNHFCTYNAGHGGAVESRTIYVGAMFGGLYDGILLGVKASAEFVALTRGHVKPLAQAAGHFTMGNP
jgi:hypothetical protein